MSGLTANVVKVTNLSVSGTTAGSVQANNFKFQNLDVSGNLTVKGVQVATVNSPKLTGVVDVSGNLHVSHDINASRLFMSGEVVASNFKSGSSNYVHDNFHLPTPTGPFAVDIIPMQAKDIPFMFDLTTRNSNKYWGRVPITNDTQFTVFAPSKRTGVDKEVSAQLMNCSDSSGNTLTTGSCCWNVDDFLIELCEVPPPFNTDVEPAFMYWWGALYAKLQNLPFLDSSAQARGEIVACLDAIKATETGKVMHKYFSIRTGKIWLPELTDSSNGYKEFVKVDPSSEYKSVVTDSDGVCGVKFFQTSYTADQLPSTAEILAATGYEKCPVSLQIQGTGANEWLADLTHCAELASKGYIVIVVRCLFRENTKFSRNDYNQSYIDMIKNGFLGNPSAGYSMVVGNFYGKNNGLNCNRVYDFDFNKVDPQGQPITDPITGISSRQVLPSPNYIDENGVFDYEFNIARIDFSTCNYFPVTDSSNVTTNNNMKNFEKWVYTIKEMLNTFIDVGGVNINYSKTNLSCISAGGFFLPAMTKIFNNSGNSLVLKDSNNNSIELFKMVSFVNLQAIWAGSIAQNINTLYRDKTGTYNFGGSKAYIGENTVDLPKGFVVPTLTCAQPGPPKYNEIFDSQWPDQPSINTFFSEMYSYTLQKTEFHDAHVLDKCIVYNSPNMGHAPAYNAILDLYPGLGPPDKQGELLSGIFTNSVSMFKPTGWDWPDYYAFDDEFMRENDVSTVNSQLLKYDLNWLQVKTLFVELNTSGNIQKQGSLDRVLEYAKKGGANATLGATYLENTRYSDSFFRFIGPHKIETLRDLSSNKNHLSIGFGKSKLYESNDFKLTLSGTVNGIEYSDTINPLTGKYDMSFVNYPPQLAIDGVGGTISMLDNNSEVVTLTGEKLKLLLALLQ